ncbi:MAG: ArsC family transcriptional regulator [Clostridia bacterium]|nr:ArsC family transcriptional regulator [Clostridia bacterium]
MNIQIFGTKKSQDTRKAERWFKERRIKAQYIDMNEKGLSRGELNSVAQACGGLDRLIDEQCRDQDALALVKYIASSQQTDAVLEHQQVLKLPIVRNGRQAAVGYCPDIYARWAAEEK